MAENGSEFEEANVVSTNGKPQVDLFSDDIPSVKTPISQPIKEKDYTGIGNNGGGSASSDNGSFTSGGESNKGGKKGSTKTTGDGNTGSGEFVSTPNGGNGGGAAQPPLPTKPMNANDVRKAAEHTADMILKGYEKIHGVGRHLSKVDIEEIVNEQFTQGTIDLEQQLPLGENIITLRKFINDYNAEIDETIVVTKEFKSDVRDALVRVAEKRGWLIEDEAYLIMAFAEDIVTKGAIVMGLRKSQSLILDACRAIIKGQKEGKKQDIEKRLDDEGDGSESESKKEPPKTPTTGGGVVEAEIISETKNTRTAAEDWRED